MAEAKTKPTKASVAAFLNAIDDPDRRRDAKRLAKWMREATGCRAVLWGSRIVGFDTYIMPGFDDYRALLKRLGKHRIGKSCLYVRKLDDLDTDVLQEMIQLSVATMRKRYPRQGALAS